MVVKKFLLIYDKNIIFIFKLHYYLFNIIYFREYFHFNNNHNTNYLIFLLYFNKIINYYFIY